MNRNRPHDPSEWFAAERAAKFSGLSRAMVNYLCRQELVEPSCDCKRGHGSKRHYSFGDVVALRLVARLSMAGVSALRLKKSLLRMREFHPEITLQSLPASHVITDGKQIYLNQPGQPLERFIDGQLAFAFVVELKHIRREVVERMNHRKKASSVGG